MTVDYGLRRAGNGWGGQKVMFVLAGLVCVATATAAAVWGHAAMRATHVAKAQDWAASGPPCAEVQAPAFAAQHFEMRYVMDAETLRIGRYSGHGECTDIYDKGGKAWTTHLVCRFSGPNALQVSLAGQDHYFLPGRGAGATLTLKDGKLACISGSTDAMGIRSGKPDLDPL